MSGQVQAPVFLNIEAAAEKLRSLGLDVTVRTLRFWQHNNTMSFVRMGRRIYIDENVLLRHVTTLQDNRVKEVTHINERRTQALERHRRQAS